MIPFVKNVPGRDKWYFFLLSLVFLLTGILGFGDSAALIAIVNKGVSVDEAGHLTMEDIQLLLGKNLSLMVTLFRFVVGFGFMLLSIRFIHRSPILPWFTSRDKLDLKRFFFSFSLTLLLFGGVFAIDYFSSQTSFTFRFVPEFFTLLLISIFLVPFQTGLEELFFRSFLMKWFGKIGRGAVAAILGSSVIFMVLHGSNPEVTMLGPVILMYYLLAGIFAAVVTVADEGIELSWGFHTANNFISILLVTNSWQVFQTDALFTDHQPPVFNWWMFLPIVLIYPLLFLAFSKKYRWNSLRKKIFG